MFSALVCLFGYRQLNANVDAFIFHQELFHINTLRNYIRSPATFGANQIDLYRNGGPGTRQSPDAIRQTTNVALQIMSLRKLNCAESTSTDGNNGRLRSFFARASRQHRNGTEYYHLMVFGERHGEWRTRPKRAVGRQPGTEIKRLQMKNIQFTRNDKLVYGSF